MDTNIHHNHHQIYYIVKWRIAKFLLRVSICVCPSTEAQTSQRLNQIIPEPMCKVIAVVCVAHKSVASCMQPDVPPPTSIMPSLAFNSAPIHPSIITVSLPCDAVVKRI